MLGFILAPMGQKVEGQYPNEINYAYGGRGTYLDDDPQYNTRGEPGLYYDTSVGGPALGGTATLSGPAIPTDVELATVYGRTPVAAAWVNAKEGYFSSPWRPPGGWNPAGAWGPQPSLGAVSVRSPWLWALIALGGVGAYLYFRKK